MAHVAQELPRLPLPQRKAPREQAKQCQLAVKALSSVPDSPPARCPHLTRVSCAGRGRAMETSAQGLTGRTLLWPSS